MSKTDLVFCLLQERSYKLSQAEKILSEVNLLVRIYHELSQLLLSHFLDYQKLIKSSYIQEENMISVKFMQEIIRDILSTEEYSISGIANHTHIQKRFY